VKHQRVKLSLGADGTAADAPVGGGVESGSLRVTIASDSTGVLSVDDNGGSLTVDGTVAATQSGTWNVGTVTTVSTVTAVTSLTNALPAGTNNIGDVDILSIVPGTAATSLGKAEDAAHTTGDTGVMSLAVRRDADTTLAGTDGDYAPLQVNAAGSLKVAITAGAGSGGTSIADGASFTRDTTSITPVGAVVETSAPTLTNGDVAGLSMTTGGALRVAVASGGIAGVIEDAASAGGEEGILTLAVRRDTAASSSGTDGDYSTLNTDANGRLHVIAALAATQTLATVTTVSTVTAVTNVATIGTSVTPGTSAAHLGKAEDAAHASGDTGVMSLAVRTDTAAASSGTTGDYEPFHTDSVGALWTRSTGELADDAAFTPATSRVMPVAYFADDTSTDSIDEGDAGAARMTLNRKQIAQPYESEANTWSYAAAAGGLVNTTGVTAKTAAGAGLRNYITSIQVINSHQTTGTEVVVRDGAAGTVIHRGWAAPNAGYAATFPVALRGTANTLVEIGEVTTTATAGVLVNLQGYVGA
jgi:hypothetical protein